nr:hypothetical protein [uncultured Friedmanniella sp.]
MLSTPPASVDPNPRPTGRQPSPAEATAEVVEVRTEPVNGVETPTQLLRKGRLWLVRSAARSIGARHLWRVQAGPGATAPPVVLDLWQGPDGRWSLTEPAAAASAELAGWA